MGTRIAVQDFALANPIYADAAVTLYTVDVNGVKTSTKATLYDAPTGAGTLANPQTLDSSGKFAQPVYIDTPVVASASGPLIDAHDTGVIPVPGTFRGDWATATLYYPGDVVRDGANGDNSLDLYVVIQQHTSGTWATDKADATKLKLAVDYDGVRNRGTWATATAYRVGDIVKDGAAGANTSNLYICATTHTSGTWATDLGAAKWTLLVDVQAIITAAKTGVAADAFAGEIEYPSNATYTLDLKAAFAYDIDSIALQSAAGTCSVKLQIDGVDITGLTAISVSTTETEATATANRRVNAGQTLTMIVSSASGLTKLAYTCKTTRVVS